jgi:hypothetical protein
MEGADVPVRLLRLVHVDTVEAHARCRQLDTKTHPSVSDVVEVEGGLPEVDLGLRTGWMPLRPTSPPQHSQLSATHLGDVAAHRRFAHVCVTHFDE